MALSGDDGKALSGDGVSVYGKVMSGNLRFRVMACPCMARRYWVKAARRCWVTAFRCTARGCRVTVFRCQGVADIN